MGYYTTFSLEVDEGSEHLIEVLANGNENAEWALDIEGNTNESCKWYDHESDMKEFSSIHPDVLFTLKGEGESNDDMWIKYFKNGKMQSAHAKISFDDFDETKLE